MSKFSEHTAKYRRASEERRIDFLGHLARGCTIAEACGRVGIHKNTYQRWRQRHPEFRAKASKLLASQRGPDAEWDGSAQDFERAYIPGPDGNPSEPTIYTSAIYDALESTGEGEMALLLLPPGARKTTTTENWITSKLAQDPEHRVLVISKSIDHARKTVGRVKSLMTDPFLAPELVTEFGPFYEEGQERKGKPWASDYITVAKRRSSQRDYSLTSRGWTSQIYGSRADTIVLDDPQTIDNIEQTSKLANKFQLDIITRRPGPGKGRVIILGTRLGPGDFYEWLIDDEIVDHMVRLPAVDSNGDPVDPIVFPPEHLPKLQHQVGEETWSAAYMQRPKLGENATFPAQVLNECKRPDLRVGPLPDDEPMSTVCGLDPNLGAGYTSVLPLAYTMSKARILDSSEHYGLSRTEEILDLVENAALRFRFSDLVIESNAFQRGLARDDRLEQLGRQYGFRVYEHQTGGQKTSTDVRDWGVATMARSFLQREIEIPWHDDGDCRMSACVVCQVQASVEADYTRKRLRPLLDELEAWRPGLSGTRLKQDRVMALWFAWRWWQLRRPSFKANENAWQGRGWHGHRYEPLTAGR